MQFNTYLKLCRTQSNLTQEALVQALYIFDTEHFLGLDTTTLSKWERAITQPKPSKQISIIRYFQNITKTALPYLDQYTQDELQETINTTLMQNIITESKTKELVLNFPSITMEIDSFKIYTLKEYKDMDKVIKINTYLDANLSHGLSQLRYEDFERWSYISDNLFLVCEYAQEVVGLLFILKLKPKSFDKIINGTMIKKELATSDFATAGEKGSSYILSFFSLNEKAASVLLIRYYAYLIKNQAMLLDIGLSSISHDPQKLIETNIPFYKSFTLEDGTALQFFRTSINKFFTVEKIIKMIFSKQTTKEE